MCTLWQHWWSLAAQAIKHCDVCVRSKRCVLKASLWYVCCAGPQAVAGRALRAVPGPAARRLGPWWRSPWCLQSSRPHDLLGGQQLRQPRTALPSRCGTAEAAAGGYLRRLRHFDLQAERPGLRADFEALQICAGLWERLLPWLRDGEVLERAGQAADPHRQRRRRLFQNGRARLLHRRGQLHVHGGAGEIRAARGQWPRAVQLLLRLDLPPAAAQEAGRLVRHLPGSARPAQAAAGVHRPQGLGGRRLVPPLHGELSLAGLAVCVTVCGGVVVVGRSQRSVLPHSLAVAGWAYRCVGVGLG